MTSGAVTLVFGNELHTTAWHLFRALERCGLDVTTEGPGHSSPARSMRDTIWVESNARWFPERLYGTEPPQSAAWVIDTHRTGRWRHNLGPLFGSVAYAQRSATLNSKLSEHAAWVPLAAPIDLAHPDLDLSQRPLDVAFVGQAPPGSRRANIVRALVSQFRVYVPDRRVSPAEMMAAYGRAKVVVNIPLAGELNMRAFEAAAARAVLVCAPTADLDEILPGSYELVPGTSPAAWINAVRAVLRSDRSQAMADAAHRAVAKAHTYEHRAIALVEMLGRPSTSPETRVRAMASVLAELGDAQAVRSLPLGRFERTTWQGAALAASTAKLVVQRAPKGSRLRPGPKF